MKFQIVFALAVMLSLASCQDNSQVKGIDFEVTKEFSKEESNNQMVKLSKLVNKAIEIEKDSKKIGDKFISLMANSPLDEEGAFKAVSQSISKSSLSDAQKSEIYAVLKQEFDDSGLRKVTSEEEVNTQMNNLSKLIEKSIKIDKDSRVRNKRIIRFIRESNLDLKMALKVFSETISKAGIQPIIGAKIRIKTPSQYVIDPENDSNNYFCINLLSKNDRGYENLLFLNSISYTRHLSDNAFITLEQLFVHNEGLILLTGGYENIFNNLLFHNKYDWANSLLNNIKDEFNCNMYIEIQRIGDPVQIYK